MKKTKFIAVTMVVLIALMVPTMAFAADDKSPVSGSGYIAVSGAPDGVTAVHADVNNTKALTAFDSFVEDLGLPKDKVSVFTMDIKLVDADGNPFTPGSAVTLRVPLSGVTANDAVTVLHFDEKTGKLETLKGKTAKGAVEFTATAFSPFAFIIEKDAAASNDENDTTPSGTNSNTVKPGATTNPSTTSAKKPAEVTTGKTTATTPKTGVYC